MSDVQAKHRSIKSVKEKDCLCKRALNVAQRDEACRKDHFVPDRELLSAFLSCMGLTRRSAHRCLFSDGPTTNVWAPWSLDSKGEEV